MAFSGDLAHKYHEIRERLRSPPNAIQDRGIDLKRPKGWKPETPKRILESSPTQATPLYAKLPYKPRKIERKVFSIKAIVHAVADYYLIGVRDLKGHSRMPVFVFPRHVAFYLACKHCQKTRSGHTKFLTISREFGRHHTTLIHGRNLVQKIIDQTDGLDKTIKDLEDSLLASHYD